MASIWITNGMHVFSDLQVLAATHPGTAGQPPRPYFGFVDPACFVGSATIAGERSDARYFERMKGIVEYSRRKHAFLVLSNLG